MPETLLAARVLPVITRLDPRESTSVSRCTESLNECVSGSQSGPLSAGCDDIYQITALE